MSEALIHFPIYIGDTLKRFIEFPTLEERGAWISIVVAMIHNDGELPNKEELYRYALLFNDKDKQSLSIALAKFIKLGLVDEVNKLINKQKSLRKKRVEAGRKGGMRSSKKQAMLKQSESESEVELELELESELETVEIPEWLDQKNWKSFLQMRVAVKSPASKLAQTTVVNKLKKFKSQRYDPNEVLLEAIVNNWKSPFVSKGMKPKPLADDRPSYKDTPEYKKLMKERGLANVS